MCLYPKLIPNPKYKANGKNRGVIPPIRDPRVLAVPIGCGNCIECRKQKARQWQARLSEDIKTNTHAKFVTLTFSNESIKEIDQKIPRTYIDKKGEEQPLEGYRRDNEIAIYAVRHYLERHRKKYGKSIRHWLVTELGHQGTENIHLHGFIWGDTTDLEELWKYGFIWKGYREKGKLRNSVNARTVNYAVKYIHKIDLDHQYYKSKILCSAGIGNNYIPEQHYQYCEQQIRFRQTKTGKRKWWKQTVIKRIQAGKANGDWQTNKYKGEETDETYQTRTGIKIALPIYYRNKIYNEDERELLWLQKLDKEERWICGTKVSIKNGMKDFYKVLEYHRERSNNLGYGNDKSNWKREEYEHARRKWQLDRRKNTTPSAGSIQKG